MTTARKSGTIIGGRTLPGLKIVLRCTSCRITAGLIIGYQTAVDKFINRARRSGWRIPRNSRAEPKPILCRECAEKSKKQKR